MAGTKFDEDTKPQQKRKNQKRGKSEGTMYFKKVEVNLYNGPDAHIMEDKRRRSRKGSEVGSKLVSSDEQDNTSRAEKSQEKADNSEAEKEKELRKMAKRESRALQRKYDLFVGRKGKEEFMNDLEKKIKTKKPDIDISEICDQFYNRKMRNGMPVASMMQVFSQSMTNKATEIMK